MSNNRFSVIHTLLVFSVVFCLALSLGFSQETKAVTTTHLTILYDNDLHGHLLPFDDSRNGKNIGGAARRTSLMLQLKKENPDTLILDAGDLLSGTPISGLFKGEVDFGTFERMPYDAMVIGNHDFDYSQATLRHFIKTCKTPVLSANIIESDGQTLMATPYIIKTFGDLTIAIIGITTPTTPITTHPKNVVGLTFAQPEATMEKYLPELKKKSDLVIALTHIGFQEDKDLAKNVNGIDVIVGGHSHTKVDSYEKVNGTIIVQDFQWGINLGKLDLSIVDKKIVDAHAELMPITSALSEDSAIAAYLQPYAAKIIDKMNTVVGRTQFILDKPSSRHPQTNLANWLADVFRERMHADIAMQNTGGTRASLNAGNITYNDLYSVLPFENTLVLLEAKGDLVQKIMDNLAEKLHKATETASVSGVSFFVNDEGKALNIKIDGKPLDTSTTYTIAVNDFMANGGSGFSLLKEAKVIRYDDNLRDVVIDYLKEHPVIAPVDQERIEVKD